jgi:hypothetical protein
MDAYRGLAAMCTRLLGAFQKLGRMADTCSLSFHSIVAAIEEQRDKMQLSASDHSTVLFKRRLQTLADNVVHACLAHARGGMPTHSWDVGRLCFGACMRDDYVWNGVLERAAVAMVKKRGGAGKGPGGVFTEEGWRALHAGGYLSPCVCMHIYIHIHVCVYVYVYIYHMRM